MLDDGDGVCLYVLGQIGFLDLPEDAFVEGAIGFGLARQFLIADGGFVEGERGFFLFLDGDLEIALGGARLLEGVAQDGGLREGGALEGFPGFVQRGPCGHHLWVLVFVALFEHGDLGFELRDIAAAIGDRLGRRDPGDGEERIGVVADVLDLFQFGFDPHPVRLRGGQLGAQFLELVFDQAAAAAGAAGAGLAAGGGGSAAELEGVGRIRFVFRDGGFAFLQVLLQPLFFLHEVTQGVLAAEGAALDGEADVFAADGIGETLGDGGIAVGDVNIDQARAPANDRLDHAGERAGEAFLERSEGSRQRRARSWWKAAVAGAAFVLRSNRLP